MSTFSKIYKNWAFVEPWSTPTTLLHGGFLNYCVMSDNANVPNFNLYRYPKNNQAVFPVHLQTIYVDVISGRPIYRLYDGLQYAVNGLLSPIRCWSFYHIWVRQDGTTYYDDKNDHTAEGHCRINYVNSDWLYWDTASGALMAKFTISDTGVTMTDYLRGDAYGIDACILYNLGVISKNVVEDDPDSEYICILLQPSEWNKTVGYCGLQPLDINKTNFGYDAKVIDYVLACSVNEEFTALYELQPPVTEEDENKKLPMYNMNDETKYWQDSFDSRGGNTDKFGQHGIYYTRLVENLTNLNNSKDIDEIIEQTRNANTWVTPDEYYSKSSNDQMYCASDGTGYFKFGDNRENRPNWFWLNSLRSWCTFKYTSEDEIRLCVWNGRNNWDSMDEILKYNNEQDYRMLAKRYMYNTADILEGPKFYIMPYSNKPNTYAHSRRRRFLCWTVGHSYKENAEPRRPFVKRMIRLREDTQFSIHDSNTYQTVKPARIYLDDLMKRYIFPIGCPMIERLPSGELGLIYHLELFGVNDKPLIAKDMIKFMNSICITYFGDGADKTIENWKVFRTVDYSQEVPSETIVSEDSSTLFEKEEINTSVVKNEFASLTFTIPTEYPTTDNAVNDDYAERWEK